MARIRNAESLLTPELREYARRMKEARGLTTLGFYEDLMVHPELFRRVETLGSFLRFHGSLPGRIREAAILMAAVAQRSAFEWQTHQHTARAAGLTREEIGAIGSRGPLDDTLELVRSAVEATIGDQSVAQPVLDELCSRLGAEGGVEVVTLAAFYRMMSGLSSAFDSCLPDAPPPPWHKGATPSPALACISHKPSAAN